jgi:hypothetical protein
MTTNVTIRRLTPSRRRCSTLAEVEFGIEA